jgi:type III secretory pathway component EscV
MSFSEFMSLVSFPTAAFIVLGFLLLVFGILYPKQSTESALEGETTSESEGKKGQLEKSHPKPKK